MIRVNSSEVNTRWTFLTKQEHSVFSASSLLSEVRTYSGYDREKATVAPFER
jgi:hypothetical protein